MLLAWESRVAGLSAIVSRSHSKGSMLHAQAGSGPVVAHHQGHREGRPCTAPGVRRRGSGAACTRLAPRRAKRCCVYPPRRPGLRLFPCRRNRSFRCRCAVHQGFLARPAALAGIGSPTVTTVASKRWYFRAGLEECLAPAGPAVPCNPHAGQLPSGTLDCCLTLSPDLECQP